MVIPFCTQSKKNYLIELGAAASQIYKTLITTYDIILDKQLINFS